MMTVMERARLLVAQRPAAVGTGGQGGHATTFGVACALVWGFGLSPEEAMPVMQEYNARCVPPWQDRDLWHKLRSVLGATHKEQRGYLLDGRPVVKGSMVNGQGGAPVRKKKAEFILEKLREIQDPTLPRAMKDWESWLAERCAVDLREVTATDYLDALYEPGEKVIVFENMRTRGDWGRVVGKHTLKLGKTPSEKNSREEIPPGTPEGLTFLMQPVDGLWRPKAQSIELSRRTKSSVTRWPYILLESDEAPHELWLNALARARLRVVSIVHSAGRSLHALVRLDKGTEEELQAEIQHPGARDLLLVLGCDPGALQSMVCPRLPNTWREGKQGRMMRGGVPVTKEGGAPVMTFIPFVDGRRMQRLVYFNPAAEKRKSIVEGLVYEGK